MSKFQFLFLFMISFYSYSQEILDSERIRCTYTLQYQIDSTNAENIREELMVLSIGKKNVSKFESYNKKYSDSLMKAIIESNKGNKAVFLKEASEVIRTSPKTKFHYSIYKNYPRGKITIVDKIPGNFFLYEEEMDKINWNIQSDKETISGYECQKATGYFAGRNYIAWFTNEIPINDGPYKFSGLPGLIVKISDIENHYVFTLNSLQKINNSTHIHFISPELKTIKTSKKEVYKAYRKFRENPVQGYAEMGFSAGPEQDRKVKERFKRENNPIELIID
ncbi:GLPGLI family protein [Sinomicrobium oceani]|uniref:GLPGLI family protein n=1 Tax=Sinomicrobium oceani TaxID=1150368 RepID=A0A1K1S044_9FLAO|nr:GLPGLI family protein [Sinomicrobium oceani]SFW77447.1 GLPGLI family protein [Sinomicrobium oceani]